MQRSSESIASLAAALAKAQAELVNPEKSLVGTIASDGSSGAARSFRYAPLSSGLDIVRKTLGQHEIATVQTTAIDQAAGIGDAFTDNVEGCPMVDRRPDDRQADSQVDAGSEGDHLQRYQPLVVVEGDDRIVLASSRLSK